ncbi:MAG: hypothetical protein K1X88_30055 [Nannocystaceae bacterium]|nr:hypothetical protein [Nannocystaceae bacterium]
MTALRTLAGAWRWVLALWLGEVAIAAAFAFALRTHVAAALSDFALPDDRLLYAAAEFAGAHPQLVSGAIVGLLLSGLLGGVVWAVLAPLVIARLADGPQSAAALGGRWLGSLGGVIATTAWHALGRGLVLMGLASALAGMPGAVSAVALPLVWGLGTFALDLSRAQVVLHGARGTAPRTAAMAWLHAIKRPKLLALALALQAAQWLVLFAGLAAVVQGTGGAVAIVRSGALVAVALGSLRLLAAISAGPLPMAAEPDDAA